LIKLVLTFQTLGKLGKTLKIFSDEIFCYVPYFNQQNALIKT